MMPFADLTIWLLTLFVDAFVAGLFLIQGLFRKFLFLNSYLLLSAVTGATQYALFSRFGLASARVHYFHFFSEVLLTILLFLSICEISVHLVGTKIRRSNVLIWSLSACAFLVIALLTLSVTSFWDPPSTTRFFWALSENAFRASCLAIVFLWAWKFQYDPQDRIAARFVNVLGVYFSIFVFVYGAGQLTLHISNIKSLYLMVEAWLPLGCGFAIVSYQPPRSATR